MSERFRSSRLIGTDVCSNIYGRYEGLYEYVKCVPYADEEGYREAVVEICDRYTVDAAIVIPEPEVLYWVRHDLQISALLPPLKFSTIATNKQSLYEHLNGTGLVPRFTSASRDEIIDCRHPNDLGFPLWMRDSSTGSTSGKGAMMVSSTEEARAWAILNPDSATFMLSEYLPGRNYAFAMLYRQNELLKVAGYERIEYFMAKVVPSGISGNISKGRLINDKRVREAAENAVSHLCSQTHEEMNGLVTVDMREDNRGAPLVTEINLRHTAPTSFYAEGGANMAEAQMCATMGDLTGVGELEVQFPASNLMLRDIDGPPIWLSHHLESDEID